MEAQQKHNDYHKKIEHARQIQKEKAIAQQLQDSIRHEKEKFYELIKTVLKKNIMEAYISSVINKNPKGG